ncbi:hypothetical protein CAEBREN_08339 [Caenorhabditis brenneri]|uniref:KIX domain-containing protein n=1 Tax=Caenorhabditis brenneri TaxID=135651 RepID=G0NJA5_CAEBE|nr:hypothetical protein CAEBREN_08339 [Caenorhabditis brenneri]
MAEAPRPNNDDLSILTPRIRRNMIGRVVSIMVPNPDEHAATNPKMEEFTEYVKYMERKAFERAQTRDDYYSGLARIIYRLQMQLRTTPPAPENDPYANIPPSHELADFMGLTQEELEEFDEEWNPQVPEDPDSKRKITPLIRHRVVDKLGMMFFPPPDPFAHLEGRMDKITGQLKQIEAKAYWECKNREEYYNIASNEAYRLQKSLKRKGEPYVNKVVKYPCIVLRTEIIND